MAFTCDKIAEIHNGQDGAVWNGWLFRLNSCGDCVVYKTEDYGRIVAEFRFEKTDLFNPHSNAVCFGCDYYAAGDEFPLFYTNIYNNYAKAADRLEGTVGVYRITRRGFDFTAALVQVIKVGFVHDPLWCSQGVADVRPYGNLLADRQTRSLYAYTMRDADQTTRVFRFALPALGAGVPDAAWGVNVVTLNKTDVLRYFDLPYSRYIQGGSIYNGVLYSTEGFSNDTVNPACIRVFDLVNERQVEALDLCAAGWSVEPEMIDASEDGILYSDGDGNLFRLEIYEPGKTLPSGSIRSRLNTDSSMK